MNHKKDTHFGYETIAKKDKSEKVGAVFNSVATNYDLMNNIMSMGLHHLWKSILIETTPLKNNAKILDIAAGTADISIEFLNKNKIDNSQLIKINEIIRNHPVEIIGKKLRNSMKSMKSIN